MKHKCLLITLLSLLGIGLFTVQCGFEQMDDPLSAVDFKIGQMSSIHTAANIERDTFYTYETILVSLDQLLPLTQTRITVIDRASRTTIKCLLVISDENGRITNLPVWYHIGVDYSGGRIDVSGDYYIQVLQLKSQGLYNNFKIPFRIINALPTLASIWPTRADGSYAGSFVLTGGAVYAAGSGFAANVSTRLYVLKKPFSYQIGDLFADVTGGYETITSTGDGSIANTLLWNSAGPTDAYDLVADVEPFGQYNQGDVIQNTLIPGLLVQDPAATSDLIQDIACTAFGQFTNQFSETDAIYAQVNPLRNPNLRQDSVSVYIVFHKNIWLPLDPLVAIPTVGHLNGPIQCLGDPFDGQLFLMLIHGKTTTAVSKPVRLSPGKYDVIIDRNSNGVYDPGIDILDGGPQVGFQISGSDNSIKLIFSTKPYTCNCEYDIRYLLAQVVDGSGAPISGVTVSFRMDKGAGYISPLYDTTDNFGIAHSVFYEASMGDWSQLRAVYAVNGVYYGARILIWGDVCYTHNQGIIIGG